MVGLSRPSERATDFVQLKDKQEPGQVPADSGHAREKASEDMSSFFGLASHFHVGSPVQSSATACADEVVALIRTSGEGPLDSVCESHDSVDVTRLF
jgi:hypothetical protein